ncbi:MAG: glycosyltransferase [Anaerolineae bacterium]|nr:glycosyltransferase [Anaerolineae bacterium]
MKILFVVPYVPNLVRVRPYNLLRGLAERGHELTLATLTVSPQDRADLDALRPVCRQVLALDLPRWRSLVNCLMALPSSAPLQAAYCRSAELAHSIDQAGDFDVAHVEHLRGAWFGLQLLGRPATRRLPVVWDSVDSISLLFRLAAERSRKRTSRWLTRFELGRTQRYEPWLAQQFDRTLVTSQRDLEEYERLLGAQALKKPIKVLPNGVDLEYYTADGIAAREPASLIISGKMSYHANVSMALHFTEHILPLVQQQRPDVKLYLVGKDPTPELLALTHNPAVQVTGTVPDIRPYLRKAAVAVTPVTYGAGIQNKVLEAMACELPVVSSSQAVSALKVAPGVDLMVADDPAEFAGAVVRLLDEPKLRDQVGRAGRAYVERNHRWSAIAVELEEVYIEAVRDIRISV